MSILMFLMTTDRLKVVSIVSNYSVCHFYHFFPLFEPPRSSKLTKSRFMATIPCSVSNHMFLMTTYRLKVVAKLLNYYFWATAEIQIYSKHTLSLSGSQMQALRRAYQDLRRTYSLPDGHVRHSDGTYQAILP